ncbi:MAG: FUSC family protein [Pseudomonadota bacterium]
MSRIGPVRALERPGLLLRAADDASVGRADDGARRGRLHRWGARLVAGIAQRGRAIDLFTPQWAYVGRSVVAAALALGLAYLLELETPYSAASTVLLIANASHGAVLAKGAWRAIGTLVGAVVAIALMAAFAQMPALFLLGFGAWLGVCAGAATVLRHFRASGAAVAGYTIGLATYGALEAPDLTLDHTLGRVATVVLGVVCAGVVTALLSPRSTRSRLAARLQQLSADVGRVLAARLSADGDHAAAPTLAADILAVDDLLALAAAESADVAVRAGAVRDAAAALVATLADAAALTPAPSAADVGAARACAAAAVTDAVAALAAGPDGVAAARLLLTSAGGMLAQATARAEEGDDAAAFVAVERIAEAVADYAAALEGLAVLLGAPPPRTRQHAAPFHRDWRGAVDNGLRAAFAIVLGGAVWIATGWNGGSLMLLVLAPYTVLLAMTGNPAAGAVEFIKGTIAAVPAAIVCAFGVLPHIDGFALLLAALAPFWAAGLYATTLPKYAPAGLAYLVAFNTLVGAGNPMTFDLAGCLNQVAGWLVAVFVTLLAFRLLLPRDPLREARRVAAATVADARALLGGTARDRVAFEHLQQHRLSRIALLLKGDPAAAVLTMQAQDALHLGRATLRIHAAAASADPPVRRIATDALAGLAHDVAPSEAARRVAAELAATAARDGESAHAHHRLVMAFHEIASIAAADRGLRAPAAGDRGC